MDTQNNTSFRQVFFKNHKSKLVLIIIVLLLIVLSFLGFFHTEAIQFLQSISTRMSESSDFVTVIEKVLSYASSSKVPLIEGYAENAEKDLDKISDYLMIAGILVKIQIAILKICNLTFFKVIPFLFVIGLFFERHKRAAFKLLLISLMINPGLAMYVNGIHGVANVIKIDLGVDLHQKLTEIKADFTQKEKELKDRQQKVKERQLAEAKAKGKDKIGFFKRAEDAVVNTVEDVGFKVKEDVKVLEEIVKIDTETLLVHLLNLITAILLLYFVLPILYFYLINLVLKSLLQFSMDDLIDSLLGKQIK